jgi:hypothetical protein
LRNDPSYAADAHPVGGRGAGRPQRLASFNRCWRRRGDDLPRSFQALQQPCALSITRCSDAGRHHPANLCARTRCTFSGGGRVFTTPTWSQKCPHSCHSVYVLGRKCLKPFTSAILEPSWGSRPAAEPLI